MDIGLMVEGQNGLTWERWSHILALAERLGFPSVFRSDHYFIGQQQDSLEAYLSFVVAAKETRRIRFGPLVTPVTFREPVNVARMAAQIDVLSGGRFVMGLGAGWNEAEHHAYGLAFPPVKERFDRLEEAIHLSKALWAPGRATFAGHYYHLAGADSMPKPAAGRPPLLIGGGGEKRTLKLVARYADEFNVTSSTPSAVRDTYAKLDEALAAAGRDPATLARSAMIGVLLGEDEAQVRERERVLLHMIGAEEAGDDWFRERRERWILGTPDEARASVERFAAAGVERIMLQDFLPRDLEMVDLMGRELIGRV